MNETVKKEQLRSYAEGILKPETVESIMYVESFADEAGDSEVWLLESDTGNEYWLIEGAYPANIIRKSGIYQSAERAFAAYVEMLQEAHEAEEMCIRDRDTAVLSNTLQTEDFEFFPTPNQSGCKNHTDSG